MKFQVALDHDAQEFGLFFLSESGRLDFEFQHGVWSGVVPPLDGGLDDVGRAEDGVVGLCGIGDEVVGVEVVDEAVELCLREGLECWDAW